MPKKKKPAKSKKASAPKKKAAKKAPPKKAARKPAKAKKAGKAGKVSASKKVPLVIKPILPPVPVFSKPLPSKSAPAKPGKAAAPKGTLLGEIEDFYSHLGVITLTLKAELAVGDTIRVKGHTTDLVQRVDSMQMDHVAIQKAKKSDAIGVKVSQKCRKGDQVFRQ